MTQYSSMGMPATWVIDRAATSLSPCSVDIRMDRSSIARRTPNMASQVAEAGAVQHGTGPDDAVLSGKPERWRAT